MRHLSVHAPLLEYEDQAGQLLEAARSGEAEALEYFRLYLPRFRRPDFAWLAGHVSEEQLRVEPFTDGDARMAVARFHDFFDWPSLGQWVRAMEARDPAVYPFECAVEAVIEGDAAALRRLLGDNPGLVEARSSRVAPFDPPHHEAALLHYVAANGVEGYRQHTPANALEIATILLDAGADPNALASMYGGRCSALSLLVSSAHPAKAGVQVALTELLIDRGASLEPLGEGNWTSPLLTALVFGYADTAEAMARRGASIRSLAEAAGLGRIEEARARLDSASPGDRHRALAIAAQLGRSAIVEMLLDAGEDPNRFNPAGFHAHSTPLHQAALAGHVETVRVLVERGARIDIADKIWHGTPRGWARHSGRTEVEPYL